jgi:serine/threonine-protein kinase HipA
MGGLRFKTDEAGPFLDNNIGMVTPPWTSLRELEHASLELERDNAVDDPDYLKWLNMLIAPGSSLGGARPKASIIDSKGHLWIAKFPSRNDYKNMAAWEQVTAELAIRSGVNMPETQLLRFSGEYHTFLSKRFDRTNAGKRVHFASAMTLLGYTDGTNSEDGVSYLEMAEFIRRSGAMVIQDLEQLWRRVVFNICVKNTDDHLRNHGFLLTERGWVLSPAFDINPNETGTGLKLNISEDDNALDIGLALEVAEHFRLKPNRASEIIEEVTNRVSTWQKLAQKYKLPKSEQTLMESAFLVKKYKYCKCCIHVAITGGISRNVKIAGVIGGNVQICGIIKILIVRAWVILAPRS